jgi:hypothetical protein
MTLFQVKIFPPSSCMNDNAQELDVCRLRKLLILRGYFCEPQLPSKKYHWHFAVDVVILRNLFLTYYLGGPVMIHF